MREAKVKVLHTLSLCFPHREPEVFSHERWVHFRAIGETFSVSLREETLVRLALSVPSKTLISLSPPPPLPDTHTHTVSQISTHQGIHPSPQETQLLCFCPDSELCSRPPSPQLALVRRPWPHQWEETVIGLDQLYIDCIKAYKLVMDGKNPVVRTHTLKSDLLLRPGKMNRQKKRTKRGL